MVLVAGRAASEPIYDIAIPAQNAAKALEQLADQTGAITLFPYDLADGKQANAVNGRFTLPRALELLLKDTGLAAGLSQKRVISITPIEAAKHIDEEKPMQARRRAGFAGLVAAVFGGSHAVAQEARPVEEIIVSATKMGSALEDTPIAVSVLSGDNLAESGIITISDLPNLAPGLEVGGTNFGPVLNIRGVSTTDNTSKGGQGIGFLVDGISIGRPLERAAAFFDVDRVEVLRGPQGTLYGKSTSGGMVSVVTRRPGSSFAGNLNLEYGNFGTVRADAGVDFPVSDKVRLRFAAHTNQSEGWTEMVRGDPSYRLLPMNDEDTNAGRLSGVFDFSDTSSLFVTVSAGNSGGRGYTGLPFGVFESESGADQRKGFGNFVTPIRDENFSNITAEFTHRFGNVDLTYVGGIRDYGWHGQQIFDEDYTLTGEHDWGGYEEDSDMTSHELRFNGTSDRLTWIAGYHWEEEKVWESYHQWGLPIRPGVPLDIANSTNDVHPLNTNWHNSSGVFGQVNIGLTDSLGLTLGLRSSDDSIRRVGTFALGTGYPPGSGITDPPNNWPDPQGNPCRAPAFCIGGPNNADVGERKNAWRVGLDYHLGERGMLYGYVATGYKQGGFNDFGPGGPAAGPVPYEPEDLTAYELGYKGELSDSVTYNSALFYYDYKKMQISDVREVAFGTFVLFTLTAPTRIKGWENELIWRPTANSQLDIELQFYSSEYVDFDAGARGTTPFGPGVPFTPWDGFDLDRVPDVSGSLGYTRDWQIDSGGALSFRIRSRYSSGYKMASIQNAYQYDQESYTRTDLNLTYRSADSRISIGLFARNLEDELQVTRGLGAVPPPGLENTQSIDVTPPRTYGLSFAYNF
jgi:iron complex outermembrane receptor protein